MPPAGYPAFLQYLQSGRVRKKLGSSCVSGGYKLEFAAIAFTASTYKRWRKSRHKCLSHKSLG